MRLLKGIPYRQILPREAGISYIGTVYFTTEACLNAHPDQVGAFVKVVIEGWGVTYADYNKAIPLIEAYDPKNSCPRIDSFQSRSAEIIQFARRLSFWRVQAKPMA
ncbi:ABC transporter substrate-binding protein [Bradyrhizobium sp. SZCCHNRI1005]|uniref:ABC transporter substrate-binding protein n=1 Tax=Bradyrhizobium sp. SZCCHNRI1005 TaxID=3057276 RepID=UPI00396574F2